MSLSEREKAGECRALRTVGAERENVLPKDTRDGMRSSEKFQAEGMSPQIALVRKRVGRGLIAKGSEKNPRRL